MMEGKCECGKDVEYNGIVEFENVYVYRHWDCSCGRTGREWFETRYRGGESDVRYSGGEMLVVDGGNVVVSDDDLNLLFEEVV